MDREKRTGFVLIIIGLLVPLTALPFVSGFSVNRGLVDSFYKAGIEIKKSRQDTGTVPAVNQQVEEPNKKGGITWTDVLPDTIPFRLFFVPTVILAYMGIIRIDRARKRKDESNTTGPSGQVA